tara:strand:+ start:1724 stop:2266 length:543 start_codon:yes stop_codon:yes gene_type:complete
MELDKAISLIRKHIEFTNKDQKYNFISKLKREPKHFSTQLAILYAKSTILLENTDNECLKRENDAMKKSIDIIQLNTELKIQNDNLLKQIDDMNKSNIHNEKMYNDNINTRDNEIIRLKEKNDKHIFQKKNLNTRLVNKEDELDELKEELIKLKKAYQKETSLFDDISSSDDDIIESESE